MCVIKRLGCRLRLLRPHRYQPECLSRAGRANHISRADSGGAERPTETQSRPGGALPPRRRPCSFFSAPACDLAFGPTFSQGRHHCASESQGPGQLCRIPPAAAILRVAESSSDSFGSRPLLSFAKGAEKNRRRHVPCSTRCCHGDELRGRPARSRRGPQTSSGHAGPTRTKTYRSLPAWLAGQVERSAY